MMMILLKTDRLQDYGPGIYQMSVSYKKLNS